MDAQPIEGVKDRLDLVSVLVLTREMDDGIYPHPAYLRANDIGGERGMAAWIVGNREGIDETAPSRCLGEAKNLILTLPARPPTRDQLDRVDEPIPTDERLLEPVSHRWLPRIHGSLTSSAIKHPCSSRRIFGPAGAHHTI